MKNILDLETTISTSGNKYVYVADEDNNTDQKILLSSIAETGYTAWIPQGFYNLTTSSTYDNVTDLISVYWLNQLQECIYNHGMIHMETDAGGVWLYTPIEYTVVMSVKENNNISTLVVFHIPNKEDNILKSVKIYIDLANNDIEVREISNAVLSDAATETYVDTKIGDIDTILDSIISTQNTI